MNASPITAAKADAIRDRFLRIAAERRADAKAAEARGDMAAADALSRLAESQERMAAKRYEAMTIRAL
jgi:hypothetical protein